MHECGVNRTEEYYYCGDYPHTTADVSSYLLLELVVFSHFNNHLGNQDSEVAVVPKVFSNQTPAYGHYFSVLFKSPTYSLGQPVCTIWCSHCIVYGLWHPNVSEPFFFIQFCRDTKGIFSAACYERIKL